MFKFLVFCVFLGLTAASSIELPVKSKHDLETVETPSSEDSHETYVDIPGGVLPVYMTFKTQSSPLSVKQEHRGTKGSYQKSDSKDEPHKLVHEVVKEVIQELKEVITPYRKVVQVVEPVKEERKTLVHKGERKSYGGDGGNNGYGSNGGYGDDKDDDDDRSYKSSGNSGSNGGYGNDKNDDDDRSYKSSGNSGSSDSYGSDDSDNSYKSSSSSGSNGGYSDDKDDDDRSYKSSSNGGSSGGYGNDKNDDDDRSYKSSGNSGSSDSYGSDDSYGDSYKSSSRRIGSIGGEAKLGNSGVLSDLYKSIIARYEINGSGKSSRSYDN